MSTTEPAPATTSRKRVFDRAKAIYPRSLASRRFRADLARVNAYFWVGRLAEGGLTRALRPLADDADPFQELSLPDVYENHLGHDAGALRAMSATFSSWRRLLALVMLASAFERYVVAASQIAAESDPLLVPGFPKALDGALLKKRALAIPARDLTGLVVGDWAKRKATFKRTFGTAPAELTNSESDLEFIRRTRNQVAHALGVDDGFDDSRDDDARISSVLIEAWRPNLQPRAVVSEDRFVALMSVVQRTVDAIDRQLLDNHIGAYELIAAFLDWKADPNGFEKRADIVVEGHRRSHELRFRSVMGELFGAGVGAAYVRSMDTYIKSL